MIPSMQGGAGGMTSSLPAGSLLGRDVPPPPVTPATQALAPNAAFPTSAFGGGLPTLPQSPVAPASPLPAGRNLAALRPNRGTNFIRLALAALFMLGFLGLAAYFLKDTISGYLGTAEEVPEVKETTPPAAIASIGPATDEAKETGDPKKPSAATSLAETKPETTPDPLQGKPEPAAADSTKPLMGTVANLEDTPVRKAEPATPAELALVKGTMPTEPPPATGTPPMVNEESSTSAATSLAGTTPPKIPEAAPGAPTPRDATAGGLDDKPSEKVPSEAEPALKTLKAFLASSTAEERSTYVLGADLMKPLLDRYYSRNNDGPITVDHISFGRYDKQPDLGTGAHCIFHIESKTWEYPVPAMLEEQADGWKVDWLTFIELKDRKLEDFFKTYQEGKAAFHVGIFRQHYFGDEVPNRDQKDAFSIGLPRPNPFRAPVFLSKDAELARQLRERLPWEVHVWAIVELEWKKLGSQQWVELVSVPQMHWYSVPAASRPISTSEKLPVEAPAGGEALPPGIKRSPAGSAPTIQKATPVSDQVFPPGIKRSPATRGR